MKLNRDFSEFLRSLGNHDVRYLIIGGYALAAHGHPRYTKDLDVWIWPDPTNAQFPDDQCARRQAGDAILALEPIDLPTPQELRRELDDVYALGRTGRV